LPERCGKDDRGEQHGTPPRERSNSLLRRACLAENSMAPGGWRQRTGESRGSGAHAWRDRDARTGRVPSTEYMCGFRVELMLW